MARIAKIKITADAGAFKQDIEKVKASIRSLGEVKVQTNNISNIKRVLEQDLKEAEEVVKRRIDKIKERLEIAGKSDILDQNKINISLQLLDKYQNKLKKITETQQELSKQGGIGNFFGSGSPNQLGSLSRGMGLIAGAAGAVGLSVGVGSLVQRQRGISKERNAIAALVGGSVTEEQSQLGFTSEERRQRLLEIARAAGQDLSIEEQNRALGFGEMAERAYGISAQDQASFMGAARKSGISSVQDQQKAFAQAIGVATAANLTGSKVGEFLASMTNSMSEMANGIDIDRSSLLGFAGALSTLPFFASNPERAFEAIKSLSKTFSQGDRFQQAMSSSAILSSVPGATPGGIEFRRQMPLFGTIFSEKDSPDDRKEMMDFLSNPKYGGSKALAETIGLSGDKIVANLIQRSVGRNFEKLKLDSTLPNVAYELGTGPQATAAIVKDFVTTGKVSQKSMEMIREANMKPEERINKVFNDFDKSVEKMGAKLEGAMDKMAKDITGVVVTFDKTLNISSDNLARFGEVAAAATTALTALTFASVANAASKTAAGTAAIGFLSKHASKLIPGVGLGVAAKDIYDIYDKKKSGKEVTSEDYMKAVLSGAAGITSVIPGGQGISAALSTASILSEGFPDPKTDPVVKSLMRDGEMPVTQALSTADSDNTSAIVQNTEAINRFSEILRQNSTKTYSSGSRYPSGAEILTDSIKTGVGR